MNINKFLLRVLNKIGLLQSLIVNGSLTLNNRKFIIPIIQKIGFENLLMRDTWMLDILKKILIKENECFVDVGVNIGQTLLMVKSVSEKARYIGFEPNPECIYYTNKLVAKNRLSDCHLIPVGISDGSDIGILDFYSDSPTDGSASIITNLRPNNKIIDSKYVPLFDVSQIKSSIGLENVSVLKIDVEGAELEVIESFLPLIEKNRPIVILEILPVYKVGNTSRIERQNKIIGIFNQLNYSLFRILKKEGRFVSLKQISEIEIHADLNLCDYLLTPENK